MPSGWLADASHDFNAGVEGTMTGRLRSLVIGFMGSLLVAVLGAAPAAAEGQTWVSAWGGRGPLSTTITTNRTFHESTPDLSGRTVRVMARLTTGGSQVRVRLSQRFS